MANETQVPFSLEEQLKKIKTQTASIFGQIEKEGITGAGGKVLLEAGALDVPNLNIDQTGVPEDNTNALANIKNNATTALASATSQEEFFKAQQELLKKQQEELAKAQTTQQDWMDKFKNIFTDRTSTADAIKTQMEEYGIPETWDKIQALIPEIGALNTELANLQTLEATDIARIEQNPQYSVQFANREVNRVSRLHAIKQAGVSAELGAKTALMNALRGNIETGRNLVSDVVTAMNYDTNQKLQDINTFMNLNQALINGLDSSQKETLNDIQKYWEDKSTNDRQDYTDKLNLLIGAADKGVNLGIGVNDIKKMTLDEVTQLYTTKVSQVPDKEYAPSEFQKDYQASGGTLGTGMDFNQYVAWRTGKSPEMPRNWGDDELRATIRGFIADEDSYQTTLDNISISLTILNKDKARQIAAEMYGVAPLEPVIPPKTPAQLQKEAQAGGQLGFITPEGGFQVLPDFVSPTFK